MTRVVLDTNVLVSGLGWSGRPAAIVDAVIGGELTLLSSPALIAELPRVVSYPKLLNVFANPDSIVALVAGASRPGRYVHPAPSGRRRQRQPRPRGTARRRADYVVSGDDELLSRGSFRGIPGTETTSACDVLPLATLRLTSKAMSVRASCCEDAAPFEPADE